MILVACIERWIKSRRKCAIECSWKIIDEDAFSDNNLISNCDFEYLHSIPLISESSVTELFTGGWTLADVLLCKRNTENFFKNCILNWLLILNWAPLWNGSVMFEHIDSVKSTENSKCLNFRYCSSFGTKCIRNVSFLQRQRQTLTTPSTVMYAKLWNHHGCKQFSICNHSTHTQPTTSINKCAKERGMWKRSNEVKNVWKIYKYNNFPYSDRCKHVTLKIRRNMLLYACVYEWMNVFFIHFVVSIASNTHDS